MDGKLIRSDMPAPVRQQLREIILREIENGTFPAGRRIPSERELAQRFGISRASVRETIAELITAGVLFRTTGRGTFVAEARSQRAGAAARDIVFLISEEIFHFVQTGYSQILRGVEAACRESGDRLVFKSLDVGAAEDWAESPVTPAGCIVVGGLRRQQLDKLRENGIPLVCVDLLIRAKLDGISSITIDYAGGTGAAVRHLHELGHRKIGFIGFAGSDKYLSFWHALEALSLSYHPRWVEFLQLGDLEPGMLAGFHAMQAILSRPPLPTAIVVTNDFVARGVCEALGLAGIAVPEQVSIIGFDDLGVQVSPPLTTVRADFDAVGRLAVETLFRSIEDKSQDAVELSVPVELVVRGSTGRAPELAP
jgi:DNA-binding LacI/PurR family transcriptional regulator